jgi:hypothetical protein
MMVLPVAIPVTIPVEESTVATEGLLLLQVPLPAPVRAICKPVQTVVLPVSADTADITATSVVREQPELSV